MCDKSRGGMMCERQANWILGPQLWSGHPSLCPRGQEGLLKSSQQGRCCEVCFPGGCV